MATGWPDLIQAIRRDPMSDAPRLVCADWLIERGDPRGDYIALACRHAGVPPGHEAWTLWNELARFTPLTDAWRARLVEAGAHPEPPPRFARGFVDGVRITAPTAATFSAICRLEPIVWLSIGSAIGSAGGGYADLGDAPELAELRQLEIEDPEPAACGALFASPFLGNLRDLRVTLTPAVVQAIARGTIRPRCPQLSRIALDDLAALVEAGVYDRIEELALVWSGDDTVRTLARGALADLRRLDVSRARLTARGFAALGPRLDRLLDLRFGFKTLDAELIAVLTEHMPGGNLRSLVVHGSDQDELGALFDSRAVRGVEQLTVYGALDPEILGHAQGLGQLRTLHVHDPAQFGLIELPGVEIRGC
ncbi:MAG TPA: TIGR02996 domain-containing protein [Kofleriaceae bacterium]|nr:TIGR02996 domain-containing protein [Kofleriaceae bacterium]